MSEGFVLKYAVELMLARRRTAVCVCMTGGVLALKTPSVNTQVSEYYSAVEQKRIAEQNLCLGIKMHTCFYDIRLSELISL